MNKTRTKTKTKIKHKEHKYNQKYKITPSKAVVIGKSLKGGKVKTLYLNGEKKSIRFPKWMIEAIEQLAASREESFASILKKGFELGASDLGITLAYDRHFSMAKEHAKAAKDVRKTINEYLASSGDYLDRAVQKQLSQRGISKDAFDDDEFKIIQGAAILRKRHTNEMQKHIITLLKLDKIDLRLELTKEVRCSVCKTLVKKAYAFTGVSGKIYCSRCWNNKCTKYCL